MKRLLFIDTETGGLDFRKNSLLTIGFVVWDKEYGILYKKEVCQKLDKYIIEKSALEINHFDINKINKDDILSAHEIEKVIISIKNEFFSDKKLIPLAGHNVNFDTNFIREMFEQNNLDYDKLFLHRIVDTYSIVRFLIDVGKLPEGIDNSSGAFDYFNIKVNGRHTALGDAIATAELYEKLLTIV